MDQTVDKKDVAVPNDGKIPQREGLDHGGEIELGEHYQDDPEVEVPSQLIDPENGEIHPDTEPRFASWSIDA